MGRKKRDETEEMLVRLFGSTSRPRILGLLINHPQQAFYQREIVYETGLSLQAVQRELKNLLHLGILKKRETEAKVYYQIDASSPWFNPLKEIYEYALEESNYSTPEAALQDPG
jgi:predicted transcriptional regulator